MSTSSSDEFDASDPIEYFSSSSRPPSRDASPDPPPRRRPAAAKKASGPMSKGWCYTLNNYSNNDVLVLQALLAIPANAVAYHIFQPEMGAQGTPHIQGFIYFSARKRRSTVSGILPGAPHLEPNKGTPRQAADYCRKDDTRDPNADFGVFEAGECPEHEQGKRNDLLAVKHLIDEGTHLWSIPDADETLFATVSRNHRSLGIYESHKTRGRDYKTALHIHEGSPGTYKSHAAQQYANSYALEHGNSGAWFDGYEPNQHETIVADEFGGHFMPYTTLKRMTDRYPMNVETKGGRVAFRAKRLVITSNIPPENWYKQPFPELERRITSWFSYSRTEGASADIPAGSVVVRKRVGDWRHHPLHKFLYERDSLLADERMLDEEALSENFDTQPVEDPEFF